MDEPFGKITMLVDARKKESSAAALEATDLLDERQQSYRLLTAAPGELASTALTALASEERFLVVVGDDQSFHDLVEAVMTFPGRDPDGDRDIVVGVVPSDPEADLLKTFGLPPEPARAARHLAGDNHYPLDIGRLTCETTDGPATRHFALVSQIGFSAAVARRAGRWPAFFGAGGRRFLAFWVSLAGAGLANVTVRADRKDWVGTARDITIGNCNYFGGGFKVSPRSYPGDGVLDVLIDHGPRSDQFTRMPKMYRGEHIPNEHIAELRAKIGVSVESDRPLWVHADGEIVGRTPAKFVVLPAAIRLKL